MPSHGTLFSYKLIEVASATLTLCDNFAEEQDALVAVRSTWAPPFIDNLRTRANSAIDTYLGRDALKGQREATQKVRAIQQLAANNLKLLKDQLGIDYSGDALKNLLDSLGYTRFMPAVKDGKQEDTIQMLAQFKQNMTGDLKAELVANGTSAALIDETVAQAATLKEANTLQETLKSSHPVVSQEAVTEFNAIYQQAIGICKIARRVFLGNPEKQARFTFSRLIRQMRS